MTGGTPKHGHKVAALTTAHPLRTVSALLLLWAVVSTAACVVLLTQQWHSLSAVSADPRATGSWTSSGGQGNEEGSSLLGGRRAVLEGQQDLADVGDILQEVQETLSKPMVGVDDVLGSSGGGSDGEGAVSLSTCDESVTPTERNPDPWFSMKLFLPPATCRVQGLAIEELDPRYNFRRAFALGFTDDPEDKQILLPYLRAAHDPSLQTRRRRVLLDLGGNRFDTSTMWFLRNYPLDFTEVHVFEAKKGLFVIPQTDTSAEEGEQAEQEPGDGGSGASSGGSSTGSAPGLKLNVWSRSRPKNVHGPWPLPAWQIERIQLYEKIVGTTDGPDAVNITRFIKDELQLGPGDAVIVKMDIELSEWKVLPIWISDRDMPRIVDELFVEIHYAHNSMRGFGWKSFKKPRATAVELLRKLRAVGFYAHYWP